ncbi:MAG: type IV pilin protein [Gammaproteobacteria bacterium]|nr:type IV pilin protein [Gammaproteobacteria bacterium]
MPFVKTYTERTNRAAACKGPLAEITVLMQEYHDVNQTYPPVGALSAAGIPYDDTKEGYTFSISATGATSYTLQCAPSAGADTDCGALTLDNFGRRGKTAVTSRTVEECWR